VVRPLNCDELIDDDDDDNKNWADTRVPSTERSRPCDGNGNDDGQSQEAMQGSEKGTGKGKGTWAGKGNGKATEDGKGKGMGCRRETVYGKVLLNKPQG